MTMTMTELHMDRLEKENGQLKGRIAKLIGLLDDGDILEDCFLWHAAPWDLALDVVNIPATIDYMRKQIVCVLDGDDD